MSFRITGNMMFRRLMSNVRTGAKTLGDLQEQMATLRRVNRPSDDPIGAARIANLRANENSYARYLGNIDRGRGILDFTASVLERISQGVVVARGKLLSAISPATDATGREAVAIEIDEILRSIIGQANSDFGGTYVFAGTQTDDPPFEIVARGGAGVEVVGFNGDSGRIRFLVGPDHQMEVNEDPTEVFMPRGEANGLFQTLIDIRRLLQNPEGLETGELSRLLSEKLADLDAAHDDILHALGRVGARSRSLQMRRDLYEQAEMGLASRRSEMEDADVADVALRLQNQQAIFELVLASSAAVYNTSLMEFLR